MAFDPKTLPPGTVINSYGEGKESFFRKLFVKAAYAAIRAYQSDKYPDSPRVRAVHTILHLGAGRYMSVTYPRCLVETWQPTEGKLYTAWVWTGAQKLATCPEAMREMEAVAEKFRGKKYDVWQLVGIGFARVLQEVVEMVIRRYIPSPPLGWVGKIKKLLSFQILGMGKANTVCSAGAHAALIGAYKKMKRLEIAVDRPLGDQFIESCTPSDFENSNTFNELDLGIQPRL